MKKKAQRKYDNWNEHLVNTRERTNYSIRRMDLLIISICGAGIYIIFETLREFKTGEIIIENENLILLSGISFLVSITVNFLSQVTGFHANNNEENYIILELKKIEGKEIDFCEQEKYDNKVKSFNRWTSIFNSVSIGLMFAGLILLAIFNFNLF